MQRELRVGVAAVENAAVHVRQLNQSLTSVVAEIQGELRALRGSSIALARGESVEAAEERVAQARILAGLPAYGEWGRYQ